MLKKLFNYGISLARFLPSRWVNHVLFLLKSNPDITDKWGWHIRPIHYYEPLPDFREVTADKINRYRNFNAIDFNLPIQVELIKKLSKKYGDELEELSQSKGFDFRNDYFAGLDASFYYTLIRDLKPSRIIEIGSGYSTRIADKALKENNKVGKSSELFCIEPYPQARLTNVQIEIKLIKERVEEISLEFFSQLEPGDILFIDSSHTAKFNSDVCREILEILPTLKPGVWIHFHDIFFPHDYPSEWLIEKRIAFNEQYMLEAFLMFNNSFSIKAANYWLHLNHNDIVIQLCPSDFFNRLHGCSSLWIRKEA